MSDIIERKETSELVERDSSSSILARISVLFLAFSIAYCVHSVYTIIYYLTDNSVPLVVCPRNFVVDSPVLMKSIRDQSKIVQDRWIRGFMRRFVTSSFPRVKSDVRPFFTYAMHHSEGLVRERFESLLKDETEVEAIIGSGSYYKFYPKHVDDDDPALRIRATDNPKKWIVEYDGYLEKRMSSITERYTPTLRYTVEAKKPTLDNPEGLYITDGEINQITDYVSNTKEKL